MPTAQTQQYVYIQLPDTEIVWANLIEGGLSAQITALTTDSNILYFQNTSVFGFGERDW